jgi:hypothetical protein
VEVDLDDGVGREEGGQRLAIAPVRRAGVSGQDLSDLVLSTHGVLQFSSWYRSGR